MMKFQIYSRQNGGDLLMFCPSYCVRSLEEIKEENEDDRMPVRIQGLSVINCN